MEILSVDLSEINFEDKSFYIPFKIIPADLISSIDGIGVINPPFLLSRFSKLIIISGWKRIDACKELGVNKLTCKVFHEGELSVKNIIKLIYEDNKQRYTDVETAQLASIFLKYEDNIASFLELIGLPHSDRNIEKLDLLSNVHKQILDLYLEEKINPDQVFILSQIEPVDSMVLASRIIIPFRFNVNETRELVKEITDIISRDNLSIENLLGLIGIDENTTKDTFRYRMKKLRYPNLSRVEEEFSDLIKNLKLPKHININHSPFFENNFIEIAVRLSKDSQLEELKKLLETDAKYKALSDLVKLARDGKQNT